MFASIYSREGESAYLLKAAPINYMRTLTTKLVVRAILMTISILLTCILYRYYATPETMMFIKKAMDEIGANVFDICWRRIVLEESIQIIADDYGINRETLRKMIIKWTRKAK